MALISKVELGSAGWNSVYYTDGTKYVGYTINKEIREGLGSLYNSNGHVIQRGVWSNNELIETLEENEYNLQVNASMQHQHHW